MALELLGHIDLPENTKPGGFDHAAAHSGLGRLYVAHTANDAIDVIQDPAHGKQRPGARPNPVGQYSTNKALFFT